MATPINATDFIGLWDLTNQGINFVFPQSWGGTELFVIFFMAFLMYLLIKTGADRISITFVMVMAAGAFAFAGVAQSPVLWGIILIGGGLLTAKGISFLFEG